MRFSYRTRYWLQLLPLVGLLAVTYWLDRQVGPQSARPAEVSHKPDAMMENFTVVKMGEQGTPSFILSSPRMLHYPDDDTSELETPTSVSLGADRPPVHMTARRGVISGNGDVVSLYDQVEVLREATAERSELTLQTEFLRILPDRERAETDRPVTIFDGRNTVHGIGMQLDNKARTITLLSQVRGVHEPD